MDDWFNVSCFTVPAAYTFGNESATDPSLRGPGINNFDFSLAKMTPIEERFSLEFRAEVFNVVNRVEISLPSESITTAANPATGYITSQIYRPDVPRLKSFVSPAIHAVSDLSQIAE
jgi:hypothetical protein